MTDYSPQEISEALEASIAKWEMNAEARTPRQVKRGRSDCPLCDLFNPNGVMPEIRCDGCPVYAKSGRKGCGGTPYVQADYAASDWLYGDDSRENFIECAEKEVSFLKSLRNGGT